MRTKIRGSYIIAFDGVEHRILKDGVVVYEDNLITHVGKSYKGKVDETIDAKGRLICPGFINIHGLTSLCITHFRVDGMTSGVTKKGKKAMLEGLRNPRVYYEGDELNISARFSFAELLKGGATTIGEITSFGTTGLQPPRKQAELFVKTAGEMGARAYISHPHIDLKEYKDDDGSTKYYHDKEGGLKGLADAIYFCREHEGTYNDRIRTMLFPYKFDACSEGLLRDTKKAAVELDVPVHMHTAQYLPEYYESLRRYGKTPIHFLYEIGFLGPKTILTHVIYTGFNPISPTPETKLRDLRDIELMAKTGTTLGYTPVIWGRAGIILDSYAKYRDMGVNIAIGTDAFLMDMIIEMRHAAIIGKVAERHRAAVTARDVFDAATLGGARALERNDLGRLAPGAKADIVIVDLRGMHTAMIDDPIKTLVYFANQRDIEKVIVNGQILVDGGRIPGLDEEELSVEANLVNQAWKNRGKNVYPVSYNEWQKS